MGQPIECFSLYPHCAVEVTGPGMGQAQPRTVAKGRACVGSGVVENGSWTKEFLDLGEESFLATGDSAGQYHQQTSGNGI